LERAAVQAGLITKSGVSSDSRFQVLNRLAIEELEAWFFNDIQALHTAHPRISLNLVFFYLLDSLFFIGELQQRRSQGLTQEQLASTVTGRPQASQVY